MDRNQAGNQGVGRRSDRHRPSGVSEDRNVCVFCSSSQRIAPKFLKLAREVGGELARRGHTLVSGGAIVSCMGEVARAARAGGARTVGVIPQVLVDIEIADTDSDELVITSGMRERKGEMDARSDAFLVLPGGIGTLEELFEIWTARVLGLHAKPLVILDPWGLYDPLRALVEGMYDQGFTRPGVFDAISWATGVPEAFDLLEKRQHHIPLVDPD
ncbi:TIGR00730 family Rossman fold protein [Acrocarpospora macrocephala]|uniref:Cytokinin riboside 5'-monophosphate phosphoribohydrolase n=1 Tax=Acrocarpospora macrocephala TaxID=150177 RepID=A0A5M3X0J0_9ACTN|nr:cytokinin riboside 5'-monophosphate phosphoribohydrolase [Acrocarpospora macrocephala]